MPTVYTPVPKEKIVDMPSSCIIHARLAAVTYAYPGLMKPLLILKSNKSVASRRGLGKGGDWGEAIGLKAMCYYSLYEKQVDSVTVYSYNT